ncbi:MAG TPA: DNA polymerase III subunit delta' [Thermodesulfovibrionales bacterium]|nr:DNA polymerase III subunit delta' [Thermodesulfovibrionales bacterium]
MQYLPVIMALRDVIGQDRAVSILLGTLERGRIPSAYLFDGESGIGKRFTALNLAKAINCLKNSEGLFATPANVKGGSLKDVDACDVCSACKKIDAGTYPDLVIVAPEKGEIRVDEIRSVEDALSFKPYEGKKKVVIIDDADTMNQSAANAFLKTLEEPPEDSLLILIASNPGRMPETIRSRCSNVKFTPLPTEACAGVIKSVTGKQQAAGGGEGMGLEITDRLLSTVVRLSMGRPGRALSSDLLNERTRFLQLLQNMIEGNNEIWTDRDEMEQWFDLVIAWMRDLAIMNVMGSEGIFIHDDMRDDLSQMSRSGDLISLMESYTKINRLRGRLDFNLNKSITWNYTASIIRAVMGRA